MIIRFSGLCTTKRIALLWGITPRRVRQFCHEWRVFGQRQLKDGTWRILPWAVRPIDGRAYRYRRVPKHFLLPIQYVDTLRKERNWEQFFDWQRFKIGSAHHLHTTHASKLRLVEVQAIIEHGYPLRGLRMKDQLAVLRHCAALKLLRMAVKEKRRLTKTLVRDFYRALVGRKSAELPLEDPYELDLLLIKARMKNVHPVIQAGDFLNEMFLEEPLKKENIRIGYLIANFILMRNGYPPIVLYRIIFSTAVKYWEQDKRNGLPPVKRRAFINRCVIRAVTYSYVYFLTHPQKVG